MEDKSKPKTTIILATRLKFTLIIRNESGEAGEDIINGVTAFVRKLNYLFESQKCAPLDVTVEIDSCKLEDELSASVTDLRGFSLFAKHIPHLLDSITGSSSNFSFTGKKIRIENLE
jgi:hypothetical protein